MLRRDSCIVDPGSLAAHARRTGRVLFIGGVCLGLTPAHPAEVPATNKAMPGSKGTGAWFHRPAPWKALSTPAAVRWAVPAPVRGRHQPPSAPLGMRAPSFGNVQTNPFGLKKISGHSAPAFIDIDDDGDLDIFMGEQFGNTFFFNNTGTAITPAFAFPTDEAFGVTDVGSYSRPAFGDLDGDGDLDLVFGEAGGDFVVFEDTSSEEAEAPLTKVAQVGILGLQDIGAFSSAALFDLDGDGDLDVISGEAGGGVWYFENTGNILTPAFDTPQPNPFGLQDAGSYSTVTLADLDADGDADAFIGDADGNTYFQENTGDPTTPAFAAPQTNPFGLQNVGDHSAPLLADFDTDGDLDLLIGNGDGNTVFFENTRPAAAPSFGSAVTNPFGLQNLGAYSDPEFVDIDGDGNLDMFSGDANGNLTFQENTGTEAAPAFGPVVNNPFGLQDVGSFVIVRFGDLDLDGDLDALIGVSTGNVFFQENTGTATGPAFAAPQANPFGLQNSGAGVSPLLADLDADGDLDAVLGLGSGNTVFQLNTGTATNPSFAAPQTNPFGLVDVGIYSVPFLADVDEDGDLDFFSGQLSGDTFFQENTGTALSPAFATQQINPFGILNIGAAYSTPMLADLDGDGDRDFFSGTPAGDTVFQENTGAAPIPAFAAPVTNAFGLQTPRRYNIPAFADLDGDGDFDVLFGDNMGDHLFFENTGTPVSPAFSPPVEDPFGLDDTGSDYLSPTFIDIDNDGDLDVFSGEEYGGTLFQENTGTALSPAFDTRQTNPFGLQGVGSNYSHTRLADIDGDGDYDAFIADQYGDTHFQENTGTPVNPAFAAPVNNAFGLQNISTYPIPAFADLDGDGDFDAFFGENYGDIIFQENTGDANTPAFATPQTNPFNFTATISYTSAPAFVDLDGDGDFDFFSGEKYSNTIFQINNDPGIINNFDPPVTNPFGLQGVGMFNAPSFADGDGDGDLDGFSGNESGDVVYFENTGTATNPLFAAPVTNPFGLQDVGAFSAPSFADGDGDGDLDGFLGNEAGDVVYFENTGTAATPLFAAPVTNPFGLQNVGTRNAPSFADGDGDGDLDGFLGNESGDVVYFENTGTATNPLFAAPVTNPFGLQDVGAFSAPSFADGDGDGDLDGFSGNESGDVVYFENTGTATNPLFAAPVTNPFGLQDVGAFSAPSFADGDGDGDLDGFLGNEAGNFIYFENQETALATTMAGFRAEADGEAVVLHWQAFSDTGHAGFEVQHQGHDADEQDGWDAVGFVEGAGPSAITQDYRYRVNALAPGLHRFRISQIDINGAVTYSPVLEVDVGVAGIFVLTDIYPNPFTRQARVQVSVARAQKVAVEVYDVLGRQVLTLHEGVLEAGQSHIFVLDGAELAGGLYVLHVAGEAFTENRSVILVK